MPLSLSVLRDNRVVLRIYAWVAGIGGIITTLFGWAWVEYDLPGLPWGMESLVRVFGSSELRYSPLDVGRPLSRR